MPRVAFSGIQELASNEACQEEGVDSQSDNLQEREIQVRAQCWLPRRAPKQASGKKSHMHGVGYLGVNQRDPNPVITE